MTSNNNGITLQSKNALDTGAFLVSAPTAVTGDVTLISDASTVTIGAGGVTVGDTLTIQIGPGLTLSVSGAINGATSVALHADAIDISAAINATGTITLAPVTVGTVVTVGGAAAAGFVIDSTELSFLTSAATLTIGKQTTGTTTAGAITVAVGTVGNATLNLFSTAGIPQSGSLTVGGGTGALNITAAGSVALGSGAVTDRSMPPPPGRCPGPAHRRCADPDREWGHDRRRHQHSQFRRRSRRRRRHLEQRRQHPAGSNGGATAVVTVS